MEVNPDQTASQAHDATALVGTIDGSERIYAGPPREQQIGFASPEFATAQLWDDPGALLARFPDGIPDDTTALSQPISADQRGAIRLLRQRGRTPTYGPIGSVQPPTAPYLVAGAAALLHLDA
jgi:hypothetical protein